MPETPPPGLPGHARKLPARPPVVPLLPAIRRTARGRPLPDAVAVRQLEVPDCAPPYDDDIEAGSSGARVAGPGDSQPGQSRTGAPRTAGARPPAGSRPGRAPATDADQWPGRLAHVLVETLAGARPERQVTRWTTEQARRRIRQLGPLLAAGYQPRVHRIIASAPAADVVEMAVIVAVGPRVRAVALRLERSRRTDTSRTDTWGVRGRGPDAARDQAMPWLCTAIECA